MAEPDSESQQAAENEELIRNLRVEDLILQAALSILNLSARRIAKEDERDLGQAKAGIDAARAMADLVPEEARAQLRQAVSELQLLYAKHAGESESKDQPEAASTGPEPPEQGETGPEDEGKVG